MNHGLTTLTEEEAQHFLQNGYVVLRDCFAPEFAEKWTDEAFERLGYEKHNPDTWEKPIVWLDHKNTALIKEVAPRAWGAICDVVGGEERISTEVMQLETNHFSSVDSWRWSDAFVANFWRGADEPWEPPSPECKGWHMDGDFFLHFLDSPEQALLSIVIWSKIEHRGGGTFIAPDSIPMVARTLAAHPEGLPNCTVSPLIHECKEFVEITGDAGDFVLLHPFMLHASSNNHSGRPRFISNPPVSLKEPMQFNRDNPAEFSLLEKTTLHHLGVDRLDFRPTAPRRQIGPEERVRLREAWRAEGSPVPAVG